MHNVSYCVETTLEVTSQAPQVVLINPTASAVMLEVESVRLFGELTTIRVARYAVEIEVTPGAGAQPGVYIAGSGGGTAATVVSKDSHDITAPSANDLTFAAEIFDSQGGLHLPLTEHIAVPPGSSFAVETADFGGTGPVLGIQIRYREVLVQPIAHVASGQLPASGAYTAATYFDVPESWTNLTFLLTYTAHASSTGARPRWRVSWSDGTNTFLQPWAPATADTSAPPVASRGQYDLVDPYPATVTANVTVRIPVPIQRMPGMPQVRLDVAELGDTTNQGTIAVRIVGA